MRNLFAALAAFAVVCPALADQHHLDRSDDPIWNRRVLLASRNSSGTMSSINGPYISGTTINVTQVNNRLSDIEAEITDSLSRSGKGGMSVVLKGVDGTVAAPAFSFTSEPGSGLYRIGAGDLGLSLLGVKAGEWTASGYRSANGALATPSLSFFNDTGSGLWRVGASDIGFAVNGVLSTEWNATGFGVGIAPGQLFHVSSASNSGKITALFENTSAGASAQNQILFRNDGGSTHQMGFLQTNSVNTGFGSGLGANSLAMLTNTTDALGFVTNGAVRGVFGGSGNFTLSTPLIIGSSGTAISASFRGTTSWTPGNVTTLSSTSTTITLTGASSGADCMAVSPSGSNLTLQCVVTANTCTISWSNPSAGTIGAPSGTYACRVFNP